MNNPRLQSEQFERASHNLCVAMEQFNRMSNFEDCVAAFRCSVDKLVRAMGMQAENQSRADRGLAPAYTEEAFANL